jgi:succinate dehydrogenase/fumarate reductase-like Fe-S protein
LDDARTTDKEARLALVAGKNGAPDCEFIYNCMRVCPKSVAPAAAIRILRDRLKA